MTWSAALKEARSAEEPTLVVHPPLESPESVALLAGSFDPPTIAHLALARAALGHAERAALVYSVRTLEKEGSGLSEPLLREPARLAAMRAMASLDERITVGVASHGLLLDQAVAARFLWPNARLFAAVGSDKVIQLLDPRWYEDRDQALDRLFEEATVLYGVRAGDGERLDAALSAAFRWRDRLLRLDVDPEVAAVSSRLVRERLRSGRDVDALVPASIRGLLAGQLGRSSI